MESTGFKKCSHCSYIVAEALAVIIRQFLLTERKLLSLSTHLLLQGQKRAFTAIASSGLHVVSCGRSVSSRFWKPESLDLRNLKLQRQEI